MFCHRMHGTHRTIDPNPNRLDRRITDSGNSGQFALSLWNLAAPPCQPTSDLHFFEAQTSTMNSEPSNQENGSNFFFAFNQPFTKPMDMTGPEEQFKILALRVTTLTRGHEEAAEAAAFSSFSFSISTLRCSACCATPCARA